MSKNEFPEGYFGLKEFLGEVVANERAYAPFKKTLIEFIRALPSGAHILDVGCGSGKTIRMIKAFRPDVTVYGTDISRVQEFLPTDVEFKQGSSEALSELYEPNRFDAVICQHVIEHLLYPMGLLQSIHYVLKSGGKVYIETPNWTRLYAPFAHFYFYNDYTHVRIFTLFSLKKALLEFGLSIDRALTVSTSTWIVRHREHSGPTKQKTVSEQVYGQRGLLTRLFARVVNPLIKDVLIVVAAKGV